MISEKIRRDIKNASWIRAMFEEGNRLRQIHGTDKVFDFSLGNPDYEPPLKVQERLSQLIAEESRGLHRYTPNAGYPDVREKVAAKLQQETGKPLTLEHIVMSCGAAGGLNVVLKTILDPGDEVIVFSPYFMEYGFYVDNHGGKSVVVPTDSNFLPDLEVLEEKLAPRCKAIILNSPNNPSGVVYDEYTLKTLAAIMEQKEKEYGHAILLISDEPYTKLVYDDTVVPPLMKYFPHCILVNSFSKSLALPGERIGYIAASPEIEDVETLMAGFAFANRTLGFVNAPSLFQKLVAHSLDELPDTAEYQRRRDFFHEQLTALGFSCIKPQGAFYLFPRSPLPDDIEFIQKALKYNLLLVPGSGFACPGYFRIAYCVDFKTIENSIPAFAALAEELK